MHNRAQILLIGLKMSARIYHFDFTSLLSLLLLFLHSLQFFFAFIHHFLRVVLSSFGLSYDPLLFTYNT